MFPGSGSGSRAPGAKTLAPPAGATAAPAPDQTPTASAVFGNLRPETPQAPEVFDFNRPDNPLRATSGFEGEAKAAVETRPENGPNSNGGKAPGQAEAFEDELDTPAFLRRRRNLFE